MHHFLQRKPREREASPGRAAAWRVQNPNGNAHLGSESGRGRSPMDLLERLIFNGLGRAGGSSIK